MGGGPLLPSTRLYSYCRAGKFWSDKNQKWFSIPTTQYWILLLCKTEILINDCFAAWTVHSHAATSSVVHCWGHNPHMVCSDQVWKLLTSIFLSFFGIIWELESVSSLFSLWGDIKHSTSHSQISSYSIFYLIKVFIHTFIPTTTYIHTYIEFHITVQYGSCTSAPVPWKKPLLCQQCTVVFHL